MDNKISEFIISKNFMFTFHDNCKVNDSWLLRLLVNGVITGIVDSDFVFCKYENQELIKQDIKYNIDAHNIGGTIDLKGLNINEFDYQNLVNILGEKIFRHTFFSHDEDYKDEFVYFIFMPIKLKKMKNDIVLFPVLEVINKEFISVTFTSFSEDKEYTLEELSENIIRFKDEIEELSYPQEYFYSWDIENELDTLENKNQEEYFTASVNNCNTIFQVAEMLVNQLITVPKSNDIPKYSWSARTLVSLDLLNLSQNEINFLQNGFYYNNSNPIYEMNAIDFSETNQFKHYICSNMSITTGNIKESYMPANILSKEITMISTKVVGLSKLDKKSSVSELLEAKIDIEEIKQQVYYKYTGLLAVHKIMNYALTELLSIDTQIEKIDSLIEVYYRKNEYLMSKKNNLLQFILGVVSLLLSLGAIFDYIISPIYEMKFGHPMSSEDVLFNYLMLLTVFLIIICVVILNYKFLPFNKIFKNKKDSN
ncbi:hypothetical protein [Vagococcus carniphilus]|uniref:hypothetical protein n=1 Tax=Vagococcus carniphilus TaxID=218144 RepID=UPI00288DD5D3|nr:hypothetical protein [Vagococcus carniphilus]MDT2865282.1 hypothetical protein [Vagococcus carniphilus]